MPTFRSKITQSAAPNFASFDKIYARKEVSQGVLLLSSTGRSTIGPGLSMVHLGLRVMSGLYRRRHKKQRTFVPTASVPVKCVHEENTLSPFQKGDRSVGQNRRCAKMKGKGKIFETTVCSQFNSKQESDNGNNHFI